MPYYADALKRMKELEQQKKSRMDKLVTRGADVKREVQKERNNRGALLASPFIGSPLFSIAMHTSEIMPGEKGKAHRHFNEAIIHIISGEGYSIIDDHRIDWTAGDTIVVPVFSWHQHFNKSSKDAVRYIACTNGPLMESLGLRQIEDKED